MKILFLGSSLEPGRDGVGDYTQMVAEECVREGHECALIALHDRQITEAIEEKRTDSRGESVAVLRLPAAMTWRERVERAVAFRSGFRPDWVSLQFVPYGFHNKGIIVGMLPRLRAIIGDARLHVFFHELWIGTATISPPRHLLVGAIQRWFVLRMLRKLRPAVIHTHTPVYISMLRHAGFSVSVLPLFSNIEIAPADGGRWLREELNAAGCPITPENRSEFWLGGFFGTLHPEWKPEPFFSVLRDAARTAGKRVCLIAVGNLGRGESIWNEFARGYAGDFFFLNLRQQNAERVSQVLRSVDFTVAASPWELICKSSAASSMLAHGAPVIVTRDDFQARVPMTADVPIDPLLHRCDDALKQKLITGLPKRAPANQAREVVCTLLAALLQGH